VDTKPSKEQQIERALRYVQARQQEVLVLFEEILSTPLAEGQTHLDLLCERLEKVTNESAKK
jgi:hypothetical protein